MNTCFSCVFDLSVCYNHLGSTLNSSLTRKFLQCVIFLFHYPAHTCMVELIKQSLFLVSKYLKEMPGYETNILTGPF